jgi:branched-chain amino acid transport system substrate-binding protein
MRGLSSLVVVLLAFEAACGSGGPPAQAPAPAQKPAAPAAAAPPPAGGGATAGEPFRFGVLVAMTGPPATYGEFQRNGIQLAVEEINEKGGVKRRRLEPSMEDDKGDPTTAVSIARKFISVDRVPLILGDYTGVSFAVIPVMDENKTVYITTMSTHPEITDRSQWTFRNSMNTVVAAQQVVEYAVREKGARRVGILWLNDESTIRIRDGVERKFKDLGAEVVAVEGIEREQSDYRSSILKVKDRNPDSVYIASFAREASLAIKQMDELGFRPQIYADPIESKELLDVAGAAAEGIIYGTGAIDTQVGQAFIEKYKQKYGAEPEIFGAQAYDTVHILAQVLDKSGFAAEQIREGLLQVKDYPGVSGNTTFLPNGDTSKPVAIKTVRDGRFLFLRQ